MILGRSIQAPTDKARVRFGGTGTDDQICSTGMAREAIGAMGQLAGAFAVIDHRHIVGVRSYPKTNYALWTHMEILTPRIVDWMENGDDA